MAIVRNTTPSQRFIGSYSLPPRTDVEVPEEAIAKYKASGAGRRRLFEDGLLVIKGAGRVVRMESAPVNAKPVLDPEPAADEAEEAAEAPTESKGKRGKKGKK